MPDRKTNQPTRCAAEWPLWIRSQIGNRSSNHEIPIEKTAFAWKIGHENGKIQAKNRKSKQKKVARTVLFRHFVLFLMSLRLALLGSTTKPRNAGVSRILLVSFEVNRQPAAYGFHPRCRKLLALRRAVRPSLYLNP
jgi:hypothetical protein